MRIGGAGQISVVLSERGPRRRRRVADGSGEEVVEVRDHERGEGKASWQLTTRMESRKQDSVSVN